MTIRECAVCGGQSSQDSFSVLEPAGAPDCDTRPGGEVRATLEQWVESCPSCGYAAPDISTAAEGAAERVRSPAFPRDAHPFSREAWLLEELGFFADAGWCALHLAWRFDDNGAPAEARGARELALSLWKRGKAAGQNFCDTAAEEFALAADVCRRAGLFAEARDTCLEALDSGELPDLIEDLLRFQLSLIQREDPSVHSLSELPQRPAGARRIVL